MSQALIQALQEEALFDHPVDQFELVETHISWVILTGPYAYKIKKPNNFGFLDFSSLEKRHHFCQEELRLNQRLAPNLYIGLVEIQGTESEPHFNGAGPAIEYAIKIRQFDQNFLLDRMQNRGELSVDHIHEIAQNLAAFHKVTPHAEEQSDFGTPTAVLAPVTQNFEQIRSFLEAKDDIQLLQQIEGWACDTHQILIDEFQARKDNGFIRECHGDLHLGNITLVDGKITLFDCIEFNQEFRIIDVMSEVAFFAMDLESRGLSKFSNEFVNTYVELTGDYAGLRLLNFYKSYRAMVRAKVTLLRLHDAPSEDRDEIFAEYRRYADLANKYMRIPQRFVMMMHGFSGSGKSTVSNQLIAELGAIRVRSDILRKQLFAADTPTDNLYSEEASDATFERMAINADLVLKAGLPLVADATFLRRSYRTLIAEVAEGQGVPLHIIDCSLDDEQIRHRLQQRARSGGDPSDADVQVYESQLESAEPLSAEELAITLQVNTSSYQEVATFVEHIAAKFG